MGLLAGAEPEALEALLANAPTLPAHERLRGPETGLVMVQGRAGGGGAFNLGEMTVTRCSVRNAGGAVGHAYIAGRRPRQAELAAALDAALQDPARRPELERAVLAPIVAARAAAEADTARRAEATRVDFATLATMR